MNVMTGLVLVYGRNFTGDGVSSDENLDFGEGGSEEDSLSSEDSKDDKSPFYDTFGFRLVLCVLTGLTGLMKLVATVHILNEASPFADLLSVLAGILGCFALFVEYHFGKNEDGEVPGVLHTLFVENRNLIGYFCIFAGLVHFVFPRIMFL